MPVWPSRSLDGNGACSAPVLEDSADIDGACWQISRGLMSTPDPLAKALVLTLLWLVYFGVHSLLADLRTKRGVARRIPGWMPAYRLAYNGLAILGLIPIAIVLYLDRGPWLWQWSGIGLWIANGLAVIALLAVAWSLRWYDGAEFLGLRQLREGVRSVEDQEHFRLSPLHRFVRHPWYALGLILVWTRPMDLGMFVSAIMITGYFAVGLRLEERKLVEYHGERYARYRQLVPSLIPSPRRYLTADKAHELATGSIGEVRQA